MSDVSDVGRVNETLPETFKSECWRSPVTTLDGLVLEQQAERGDMVVDCEWEREKSVLSGKATGTKWGNRRRRPVAHQDSNRDRPGTRTNNVGIDN